MVQDDAAAKDGKHGEYGGKSFHKYPQIGAI
jgi:hypothetical protein